MAEEAFHSSDPLAGFTTTLKEILLDPRGFFERLPLEGGLKNPLIFAVICTAIGGLEHALFTAFRGYGLKAVVGLVILGVLRLFVGAGVVAVVAQHLFGGRGDYEANFRVLGYASAVMVLIGLPFIKWFAALYGVYLTLIGIERANGFDSVRAFLTLIATFVVGVVLTHAFGLWRLSARVNPLIRCHAAELRRA
jgi:hypothetical protein